MLSLIFVVFGIVMIAFSVFQCIRLIKINSILELRGSWYLLLGLIIFFLVGYTLYLISETGNKNIPITSILISLILFFGAIFVMGVLSISYNLIKKLTEKTNELNLVNETLTKNSEEIKRNAQEIENQHQQLIKTEGLLKDKNKELEDALEDFYTIRIDMQRDMDQGNLDSENKKIRKRLDELKAMDKVKK